MDCEAICEIFPDSFPPLPPTSQPDRNPAILDSDICKKLQHLNAEVKRLEKMKDHLIQTLQMSFEMGHQDTNQYMVMTKNELLSVEKLLATAKEQVSNIGACPLTVCSVHKRANSRMPVKRGNNNCDNSNDFIKPSKRHTANKNFNSSFLDNNNSTVRTDKNLFNCLTVDEAEEESTPSPPPRPAPVMVRLVGTVKGLLDPIKLHFADKIQAKLAGEFIKIFPSDEDIHRQLTNYLAQHNIEFYLITPRNRRPIKVVIKGLPIDTPIPDIVDALGAKGYQPTRVVQLVGTRRKNPLPMFQVILERSNQNMEIYELRDLLGLIVKCDPFRRKIGVVQCFRCNFFHHSQINCHLKERCLKCGQNHRTNDCDIQGKIENPQCINCTKQGHVAAWRGCEKFPKNGPTFKNFTQQRSNQTLQNSYQNSNNSNFVRAGTSYAHALKRPELSPPLASNQGSHTIAPPTVPSLAGVGDILYLINEIASVFGNQNQITSLVQKLKQTTNPADKLFLITNGLASNVSLFRP